jgi:DNA-binding CsgD family transcriptional regulator
LTKARARPASYRSVVGEAPGETRARRAGTAGPAAPAGALASCGDALVAVADDLSVLAWNEAATAFTGLAEAEVLGGRCYLAVAGVAADGSPLCGPLCPLARDAFAGRPVARVRCRVRARGGSRAATLATIRVSGPPRPFLVHLLLDERAGPQPEAGRPGLHGLSARQREVLGLLSEGVRAQEIAQLLGLSPTTVRNHIRAILSRLGCHSQIEAIAEARRRGLG